MKEAHEMNKYSFNVSKQVGEDLLLLFIIYTLVFFVNLCLFNKIFKSKSQIINWKLFLSFFCCCQFQVIFSAF